MPGGGGGGTVGEELEVRRKGRLGHMVQVLLCPAQESGDVSKARQSTRQLWAGCDGIRVILLDMPGASHGFECKREMGRWVGGFCLLRRTEAVTAGGKNGQMP